MATQIYSIVAGKAGKYVAGIRLEPGQTTIELTPEQAAYELSQSTILPTGQTGPVTPETPAVLTSDRLQLLRTGRETSATVAALRRAVGVRPPNTFAFAGNSLAEAQYIDPGRRVKGSAGFMNWMAGFLRAQGKPMLTLGNFAHSGDRTDQYAPGVAAAIATGAANLLLTDATNDVGQVYPSAATVVATAVANLKAYIKQADAAGMRVFFLWMRGAQSWSQDQIGYMNDINRQLAEFIMRGDDEGGPPNVVVLDSTPYAVVTGNPNAIELKHSEDGTHDNITAARIIGAAFAEQVGPNLRCLPGNRSRLTQGDFAMGTRGLLTNPGLGGTDGQVMPGTAGVLPSGLKGSRTGTATAVFSVEDTVPDANGNTFGKQIKIVVSGGASGGEIQIEMPFNQSRIVVGDRIRSGWEIDVAAGATAFGGVEVLTEWYPQTGQTAFPIDGFVLPGSGVNLGGYAGYPSEPDPLPITPFTGTPWCNSRVRIPVGAGGSATVTLRKPIGERS